MWIAVVLGAVVAVLLVLSASLPDYGKNLSLNLGADLIGTIIVLFAVSPFMARVEGQRETVRDGFDRGGFIKRASDARREILILELWTDLLQGTYQDRFLESLREALRQQVKIKMLLLSPDARAAEQRADELLRQTNVVGDILDNLRVLHEFVHTGIPEVHRHNIDVRVYSALPPVQMYQVDTQVTVSFYPVNVTSWNATQYLTSPDSQLGKFVGDKFDELWKAGSTRSLDQFWKTTIIVDSGADRQTYDVGFVMSEEDTFISGQPIIAANAENGISGLVVRTFDDNVTGEQIGRGPFSLVTLEPSTEDYATVHNLFSRKYGEDNHVILKLVGGRKN
ncbi:hypothetical protein [Actinoallomurus oryzae]|uniref:hypothetical protein n=1 Tax=Actinoallomurus oryzae TaxID=502180 RepID=UPI0031EBBBFD